MDIENDTLNRILLAALRLFMAHGVKRTSLEEIAQEAGITRVTVYRHFTNKRELVRATFLHSENVFQEALHTISAQPDLKPTQIMNQIGQGLAALPPGNLIARLEELERLYPDVYAELQQFRLEIQGELFNRLFDLCEQQGTLRPGLNRIVARAVLWEILVHILRNPELKKGDMSDVEFFNAVTDIILHGISTGVPEFINTAEH